ncbi:MAG: hypothetical protein NDI61_11705, partial [Bdellovibrionaceae bacterium]|nr:hypothetical protein [Pseudobdellovibrionaceae bacterium]
AIREIPEPQEDIIAFIASYMNFSAINAPRSPLAFLESRSYIGGAMTQLAHPSRRDEVGAIVERKLKSLGWKDENSGDGTRSGMTMQTTEQTTEQNTEQTTDSAKSIDLDQD